MPANWVTEVDPASNQIYYVNTLTGESSWEAPGAAEEYSSATATINTKEMKRLLMSTLLAYESTNLESGWYCVNEESGQPSGPFSNSEMAAWYEEGYLKPSLEMRYGQTGPYLPFYHLFDLVREGDNLTVEDGKPVGRNPFDLDSVSDLYETRHAVQIRLRR